jgi:3'5'-cyclic nucleotide phosphodiesterase
MEGHSLPGKVLCTQKTADLLIASGKQHWLTKRDGLVSVKGKGSMTCYWCKAKSVEQGSFYEGSSRGQSPTGLKESLYTSHAGSTNNDRLVGWVVNLFEEAIGKIEVTTADPKNVIGEQMRHFTSPREEVSETIALLSMSSSGWDVASNGKSRVSETVKKELQEYVSSIANAYRNNSFHNFEHACHVVLATKKLLSRVIKPMESSVSSTSYGLTSDPMTHFGILLSALIHDVDHPGVSNAQLIKEMDDMAMKYNNQSVAEQNSVTIAWDLLMQEKFSDLRSAIAQNHHDLARLRQILVNSVIATDLFDNELRTFRENRWKKAFELESNKTGLVDSQSNLRAAIVIEHIIQASDVSHTMQHWHVYQKWNQRLFSEMYTAYLAGRAVTDPSNGWYEGELWFFDNYIIPLAKKLKTCGVFGVSCDEFLDYALDNRVEWEAKGRDIVTQFVSDIRTNQESTCDSPLQSNDIVSLHRRNVANALEMVSLTVVANESVRSL